MRGTTGRVLVVLAVAAAVLVPSASPASPASPGRPSVAAGAAAPGTLRLTGRTSEECPTGFRCFTFSVACAAPHDHVPPMSGTIAVGRHATPRRGTLVTFGGGGGQDLWLTGAGGAAARRPIAQAGIEIVAVAWDAMWNVGTTGFRALSCGAATAVAWAAARDAAQGSVPPEGDGACGVCVIGYSVGSTQAASAVAFHDVAHLVDAVVAVAGPTTADIAAGCRRDDAAMRYLEPDRSSMRRRVDDSFDAGDPSTGPCSALPADLATTPAWDANSLVPAGRLEFPTTRFHYVWGADDRTGAVGQGIAHLAALAGAGSPLLAYRCLDAHHDVFEYDEGVGAIVDAVLWAPADGVNAPPVPVASPAGARCPLT